MAKSKQVVAWPEGTDPMSPEERAAARERGKALVAKLKAEAKAAPELKKRAKKVAKLNTMGADANAEKKRMRVVVYKGAQQSAGTAWNPNGKRRAK